LWNEIGLLAQAANFLTQHGTLCFEQSKEAKEKKRKKKKVDKTKKKPKRRKEERRVREPKDLFSFSLTVGPQPQHLRSARVPNQVRFVRILLCQFGWHFWVKSPRFRKRSEGARGAKVEKKRKKNESKVRFPRRFYLADIRS
jgi:hypothetical protein